MIDLRSDTLTVPTEGMRAAMAAAEVGDDVYDEDPTVRALQDEVAALFGHEAALFVPSGTMGNQLGVRLLVPPGAELLCDADAHVITYEYGAAAVHGGITTRTLTGPLLDPTAYVEAICPAGWGTIATAAIAVENTHNRGGGLIQPISALRSLRERAGVPLHCDGARIWNAHVATGVPLTAYGALFDTMSVCLSKGLGAPVGSVVVSTHERITRAREVRARMGGAMRQAGVLAGAGLFALRNNIPRLADDHRRAKELAVRLAEVAPDAVDPAVVETNLVLVDVSTAGQDPAKFATAAAERNVLLNDVGPRTVRLVTHLDIDDEQAAYAGDVLCDLLG